MDAGHTATRACAPALHHKGLAHGGLGDHEAVHVKLVVIFCVRDRAFETRLHRVGNAAARELQIHQSALNRLASDLLRNQVELLRANAEVTHDRARFRIGQAPLCRFLAHNQPRFDLRSAAWP